MREKLAYLAGLIDGEGCFGLQEGQRGVMYPFLRIRMTDEAVVRWLAREFGGQFRKQVRAKEEYAALYEWDFDEKRMLLLLLPQLLEFLQVKRHHAGLILEFCRRFRVAPGRAYSAEVKEEMCKYKEILHVLNGKGSASVGNKAALILAFDRRSSSGN